MFVDTDWLHSGANHSYRASGHAQDGAGQLSRGPLSSGMFGDFATADVFHQRVRSTHAGHVRTLQTHHQMLTAVGDKADHAATEFTTMDEHNAAKLRVGQCNSDT
jgi:uncharacterized protein DUF2563